MNIRLEKHTKRPKLDPEPVVFRDYHREFDLIRRLHRLSVGTEAASMVMRPALALAKLLGRERLEKSFSSVDVLDEWASRTQWLACSLWKFRYGSAPYQTNAVVRSLAKASEVIGTLKSISGEFHYHDVFGIPVAPEPFNGSEVFYSPASAKEILACAAAVGSRWIVSPDDGLKLDDAATSSVWAADTRDIIERTLAHDSCRGWVLWGPPRGGKSMAARQIADAVADGWLRVCGRSALDPSVWAAILAMRPAALILDDLDACAKEDDALLGWIEEARVFCKVIISTMNILPEHRAGGAEGAHDLRGALLAPGRAADERPRRYDQLDETIRRQLAPSVPAEFRGADLLAGYLVELEKRALVGTVTQADVDEMRERMVAVGDR